MWRHPGIMAEFSEFMKLRRRFKTNEEPEEEEKSEKHTHWLPASLAERVLNSARVFACRISCVCCCLMMLCYCCAAAGSDEAVELKPSARINRDSVFWLLASVALTYYVDFFSVVLNHTDIHRWLTLKEHSDFLGL